MNPHLINNMIKRLEREQAIIGERIYFKAYIRIHNGFNVQIFGYL